MNIKKCIASIFLIAFYCTSHPSKALGVAAGPSVGIAGFYSSFDANIPGKDKITISNCAVPIGMFLMLDAFLYIRFDILFVPDWYKLPNDRDAKFFKHITVPITLGISLLDTIRPHCGIIFQKSFLDDDLSNKINFVKEYKEHATGYLLGVGLDLGNFLIDLDFKGSFSSIPKSNINHLEDYNPKQIILKVGYNLVGLMKG
ncbi:hypothetical protein [Cardinium endosymbiont of Culicoides punctatus]|uniref:hypothetical protein n=1 Tax=Cardinium endosymbiont of Culicoides punctatus TaxID=2304601 RepID=UPI0010589232|nr:hypothetical protein [Cardinium endosymbiont of Culicoides punctatus]